MSITPLVTVYITNYNYEQFIETAIESVLAQTIQDFELFIIDDGSTDNSKEIIERYRSNDKISIIYQQNKGLNITNNVAMRAANGKYLMRLDADDFLEPNAIELMSQTLEQDEQLGLVFPDYYYVDANGQKTGQEKRHNFEKEVSLYDQPAHGACTMVRLSFLKALGGYNESFTCQDGYDLWIKFVMHHKVTNITQPLFSYRRHGNNLTTNEDKILKTRKQIKAAFVKDHLKTPKTVAIIPVRDTYLKDTNIPLLKINGKTLLENKIDEAIASELIEHVIVSTASDEILKSINSEYFNHSKVSIIERPKAYSAINQSLYDTIVQGLEKIEASSKRIEAVMTLSVEYPFTTTDTIEEAINTLALFKSDAVMSVRPDNQMYFQHNGHTLTPILDQDKFTKYEREALYKGAGGVVLSTIENLQNNKKMASGTISHVVVDQKTAFGIFSLFDFELLKSIGS